ncbi:MAG: Maf family protein [Planctomyces sp.]|jgi:septum formation protein
MMSAGNHTPEIPLLLDPATFTASSRIILGSRSPRRRDLLSAAAGAERIVCLPPISSAEDGFLNLRHDADIQERLLQITHAKHQDVSAQISSKPSLNLHCPPVVVVADTTVVAGPQDGHREVLGQPDPTLQGADVRDWFLQLLSGKTHQVLTAVLVSRGNQLLSQIVTTEVEFLQLTERQVDWYLATGEPQGKAGGYAIQGLAAAFVKRVSGSLTCVIGLPLLETLRMIHDISHQQ